MFAYNFQISEAITRFIGLFALDIEEMRGRSNYEEFKAEKAVADISDLSAKSPAPVKVDLTARDYHPGVDYEAPAEPIKGDRFQNNIDYANQINAEITPHKAAAASKARLADANGNGGNDVGVNSTPSSGSYTDIEPLDSSSAPEFIPVYPGSVALVVKQINNAIDDDFLSMSDDDVELPEMVNSDMQLLYLTEAAQSLDIIPDLELPEDETALAMAVHEASNVARHEVVSSDYENAVVANQHGDEIDGIFYNGENVETAPVVGDFNGDNGAIEDDVEPAPEAAQVAGVGAYEIEQSMDLVTGGNELSNVSEVHNAVIGAPVIVAQGDAVTVDLVSQSNVWADEDHYDDALTGWQDHENDEATTAHNVAQFNTTVTNPQLTDADDAGSAINPVIPQLSMVSRLEGNLVFTNWLEQRNFIGDQDTAVLSASGVTSNFTMGENILFNVSTFVDLGFYYDMVVIEGSILNANIISQQNVLLDNDMFNSIDGFGLDVEGAISSHDNILWNEAIINRIGEAQYSAMPDHFAASFENPIAEGFNTLSSDIMADSSFVGLSALRVLVVEGDLIEVNYIGQQNILGDSDQMAFMASELINDTVTSWTVDSGNNSLSNTAVINDYGVDNTIYVGGESYSDAMLHQAELVSSEPISELGGGVELINEAVALFVENIVAEALDDDNFTHDNISVNDVPADPMQTMLS